MSVTVRFIAGLLLLLAGAFSQSARAENCQGSTQQMTINFNNIRYLPTLGNNLQMSGTMADNGGGIHFTCDQQASKSTAKQIIYRHTAKSIAEINGHEVFSSALPGIGYSLSFQCGGGPMAYLTSGTSLVVCDSATLPEMLTNRDITVKAFVTFYKTGPIQLVSNNHAFANALPGVGSLTLRYNGNDGNSMQTTPEVSLELAAMNVEIGSSGSCSVSTGTVSVNLGKVNRTDFNGPGSTGGRPVAFTIPVYCTTPTDIRIGFFGTPAVTGSSEALAVSAFSGSAKGIGIRLSYGNNGAGSPPSGTVIALNEAAGLPVVKHITTTSASAATPVQFFAQYVQTEATVTAGPANSRATFVLDYN